MIIEEKEWFIPKTPEIVHKIWVVWLIYARVKIPTVIDRVKVPAKGAKAMIPRKLATAAIGYKLRVKPGPVTAIREVASKASSSNCPGLSRNLMKLSRDIFWLRICCCCQFGELKQTELLLEAVHRFVSK